MLGALEVKAIARLVAQHRAEWKPVHTAVMGCLLAHRNRRTEQCWPRRKDIAAHCNVSESTIDRAIARLTAWGAIERMQPKAASSQQFRPAQYVFRFELPQAVEKACELEDKTCADQPEPCVKNTGAVRHLGDARNKERRERSKEKDLKGRSAPSPVYTQRDFDERDWRKLNRELEAVRNQGAGRSGEDNFAYACQRAGISVRRGYELWEKMMTAPKEDVG